MAHAICSPSSSERWFKCAASALLNYHAEYTVGLPAATGTLIHSITEMHLKDRINNMSLEEYWLDRTELIETFEIKVDQDMIDCAKVYVDYINKRKEELDATLLIEEKFTIDEISDKCHGTADAVLIGKDRIQVVDLKTGTWPVDPTRNKQLMIYGLGVLTKYGDENTIMELSICQPRVSKRTPVKTFEITAPNLVSWGFNDLKPAIEACFEENPQYVYGDHCRFCSAKDDCETYNKRARNL